MSESFHLGGDPAAIRASGQSWKSFASAAQTASSDLRSVDSATFVGDEGDTYRDKINSDLPPRLDKTHEAWDQVGVALVTYAGKLEDFQARLATLKQQYDSQQQTVQNKSQAVSSAQSADASHAKSVQEATAKLKPGETLPPSTYSSQTSGAQSQLTEAQNALQETITAANKVRSEHKDALNACCDEIESAKHKRFEKPPGFWGKLKDAVVDWVKDHADVLKAISGVLKIVSAIAGVLSFIPILAPIMGPIALATGALALGIDVVLKLATGEGSWASIGLDAALMLLPGAGKLLKPMLSGTKAATSVSKLANLAKIKGARGLTKLSNNPKLWRIANTGRTPRQAAVAFIRRNGQKGIDRINANPVVRTRPSVGQKIRAQVAVKSPKQGTDFVCPRSGAKVPAATKNGVPVRRNPETGRLNKNGEVMPDSSKMDLGHKPDHDWSYTRAQATAEGRTRAEVSAGQRNPDTYHGFEERGANRSAGQEAKLENLLPGRR